MVRETMTAEERVLAAIHLEPYDRVPVVPLLSSSFRLVRRGIHVPDVYTGKVPAGAAYQAMVDLLEELAGWDGIINAGAGPTIPSKSSVYYFFRAYYGTMRPPGIDARLSNDSSQQFAEREVMLAEDYDEIMKVGWQEFMERNSLRITGFGPTPPEKRAERARAAIDLYLKRNAEWNRKGAVITSGFTSVDPQMGLSLLRTLPQFTMDLYRRSQKVKAVLDAWVDDFAQSVLDAMLPAGVPDNGLPGITLACERGSGQYYNLKIFEQFVWPYIKKLVEVWTEAGFVVTLHFDTNWTLNLPYLLQLPRGKCICELDSTMDIFKAKEILKDHMCIMGDVPPQLSALGKPEEMEQYCKKLIDIVGKKTGFILSTGCEQPPDTRFENFKVMIETAKYYYPHN